MKKILKNFPFIYKFLLNIKHGLWSGDTKKHLKTYLSNQKSTKLQLGAGANILTGWFNTDYFPRINIFFLDVTKPFPMPSNTFEFIYSEHHIEHISYKHATQMLKEIFRVMKPGGYIKISTPDLQKYLSNYIDETAMKSETELHAQKWIYAGFYNAVDYIPIDAYYKAHFVNDIFLNYDHHFIYDYQSLANILKNAGFSNIIDCSVKISAHPEFQNIETHASHFERYFTLSIEAQKPLA